MSFGGAVSAMIHSLKNNKRDRKTLFDKKGTMYGGSANSTPLRDKKASPEHLEEIRNRLKKERRNRNIKLFSLFFLIILGILIKILKLI